MNSIKPLLPVICRTAVAALPQADKSSGREDKRGGNESPLPQRPPPRCESQTLRARVDIAAVSARHSEGSSAETYYPRGVGAVNQVLQELKVPVSAQSAHSVMQNMAATRSGELSYTSAHLAEVSTFGRDAVSLAADGQVYAALVPAAGALLNAAAALTAGPVMDAERQRRSDDPAAILEQVAERNNPMS